MSQDPRPAAPTPLTRDELERLRARDPDALGRFFERYVDHVFGLAHRLLGDREAAQDLTQEVFLKVYRAASQLDPGRDPTPWVTAITCNACRDVWRSGAYRMGRRSDSIEDDPSVSGRLAPGTNDPERDAIAGERERIVQEALQEMPPQLREVIVLHDWQGLDHREIASLLGIGHAAARKRYSRALGALAARLDGRLS
jgi:RNA polymerase sigma-70 factor (ECF subfamily)